MKKVALKKLFVSLAVMSMILSFGCKQKTYSSWKQDEITGKWGYFSYKGELSIPYKYDSASYASWAQIYKVCDNGKWGIVDVYNGNETIIIPCQYDFVGDFNVGKSKVNMGGKWGLIDATGKEIVPCKYDSIYDDFSAGLYYAVCIDGKWGILGIESGDETVPCIYDYIGNNGGDIIAVRLGEKDGRINRKSGEVTMPLAKRVYVSYSGTKSAENETVNVSFVLKTTEFDTAEKERTIGDFSFSVEKKLGAGDGALERTKSFSVNTAKEFEVPANGVLSEENIKIAMESNSAVCTLTNDGQQYTCTAYPEQK